MRNRSTLCCIAALVVAPVMQAQATFQQFNGPAESGPALAPTSVAGRGGYAKYVTVPTTADGGGVFASRYLPDGSAGLYRNVVNLWFRNPAGAVIYACSGSLLAGSGGLKILTAGHCVSNGVVGSNPNFAAASFTARFQTSPGVFTERNGTGFAVNPNYGGFVEEEHDVGVLTLSTPAPAGVTGFTLFSGNPLNQQLNIAGYGLTGDGDTGGNNTANNQFGAVNVLRAGTNSFNTTGRENANPLIDAALYATSANPSPSTFGGILVADFDRTGGSPTGWLCASVGFCETGYGLDEVGPSSGDSGSAAFSNSGAIAGVASWGLQDGSFYSDEFGYACVANFAANAGCKGNYDWIQSQLSPSAVIPEPSTYVLFATGLLGLAGIARRRRTGSLN